MVMDELKYTRTDTQIYHRNTEEIALYSMNALMFSLLCDDDNLSHFQILYYMQTM